MSPRKGRPTPDPRHAAVKDALAKYWAAENPHAPDLPWGAAEAGCIGAFLRANPSLTVELIEDCLSNRLASEDHAPGEGIFRWFRDLLRYGAGPLDRYRLPKRVNFEASVGRNTHRSDVSAEETRQWFLDRARSRKAEGSALTDLDRELLRGEGEL